ncbi:MAG: hypothetical protein GY856_42690, partial [bacterium]|nr:hypothetical protein [bacterium]
MDNDRPEQSRKRHRLLGEVDGRVLSLPLVPGDNRLGSADDNHLVLRERGVSR